jgi:hypothetical protein
MITRMLVNEAIRGASRAGGADRRPPVEVPGSAAYIHKQMQAGIARKLGPKPRATAAVAVPEPETVAQRPAAGTVARRDQGALEASCQGTDGVKALSKLSEFHQHYDYWEHSEYADLLAAYDLMTHAREDDGTPVWRAVPRLIVAGMHGTGKDGTMAQIAAACATSVLMKTTYPGIRDCIGLDKEVAILNEAQITFGAGRRSEDVRLIVNAHVKGNMIRDGKNGKMNVFGHVVMAGLPKLLTGKVSHEIADTISRCFILWKVRKPKDYFVPEVTDAVEAQVREIMVPAMREWCMSFRGLLKGRAAWFGAGNPTGLPDLGGGGRGNDQLARPLLSVCDVATALAHKAWREAGNDPADFPPGQNWAERIRKALIFASGVPEPVDDEESPLDGVSWGDEADAEQAAASVDILAGLNGED